jgi:hypothetical protein
VVFAGGPIRLAVTHRRYSASVPGSAVETLCEWFRGPTALGNVDWISVEAELGTRLPTDYRHLWDRTRLISLRWLHLASPTAIADNGSLADLRGLVPDLFEAGGCSVDWPAAEDLMPWGHIDVIPMFCWDMSSASDPDDWHTLVFDTDVCRVHRIDRTMTACVRDRPDDDGVRQGHDRRRPDLRLRRYVGPGPPTLGCVHPGPRMV